MESKRNLRLLAIAAERTFPNQQPNNDTLFKRAQRRNSWELGRLGPCG
jgi:hypothetical protein